MKFKLLFLLGILSFQSVKAEIQDLQIRWRPASCVFGCAERLGTLFQRVPGVAGVNINAPGGQMNLRWQPNVPLTFQPINAAFSMLGLTMQDFRVKVRGTLQGGGTQFNLASVGDNTPFLLLGFPQAQPTQSVTITSYNPRNFPLSPGMVQQLSLAASQGRIVIVEGYILAPERSPPWMLIVQNIQFEMTPQEMQQQQLQRQQQQQQQQKR